MNSRILYQVNEVQTESSKLTCRLQTIDPFLALSDYLLKALSPLHFVNLSLAQRSLLTFRSYPFYPDFCINGPFNMAWTLYRQGGLPVTVTSINSVALDKNETYFHPISDERYKKKDYFIRLEKCREALLAWTKEDLDVACVLAGCALIDYAHPFWREIP
ncbi:hypothetical protein ACI2KR_07690 [Pseudomonas luteola]